MELGAGAKQSVGSFLMAIGGITSVVVAALVFSLLKIFQNWTEWKELLLFLMIPALIITITVLIRFYLSEIVREAPSIKFSDMSRRQQVYIRVLGPAVMLYGLGIVASFGHYHRIEFPQIVQIEGCCYSLLFSLSLLVMIVSRLVFLGHNWEQFYKR